MKKFLLFAMLLLGLQSSYAALPGAIEDVKLPSNSQQQTVTAQQFVKMSVKDYETVTGKKLNLFERVSFKIAQYHMKRKMADRDTKWLWIGLGALIVIVLIVVL